MDVPASNISLLGVANYIENFFFSSTKFHAKSLRGLFSVPSNQPSFPFGDRQKRKDPSRLDSSSSPILTWVPAANICARKVLCNDDGLRDQ